MTDTKSLRGSLLTATRQIAENAGERTPVPLRDDLLTGVPAIADHIGWPPRKTYHALERGHLPAKKVGAIWTGRKSELDRAFSAESEAS